DPLEYKLPLLDLRFREYEEDDAPLDMQKISSAIRESDALVFVTGEYNHGIPPAMKNIIDHFGPDYKWRVAAIASYSAGNFGGIRAALALRTVLSAVGLMTLPATFAMSKVQDSFNDKGEALEQAYETRIQGFLDELEWYASAIAKAREKGVPGS
ncbi:MAG: NAD(P)H-dependent oxidoreductase, partial [Gammaproteobacteria bacterium]|nr:NAD(P)H-dependent oxidoreductase [Gammaproteobacteria bacterium]